MNCVSCSFEIDPERLEAIPGTLVCGPCARQGVQQKSRPRGVMIYTEKTNGFIEIHTSDSWERNKKYYVAHGARSAVKNFSKNVCS